MPSAETPSAVNSIPPARADDPRESTRDGATPAPGAVDFGSLRRIDPVSRVFGFDRGQCIDRFYIDRFLARHAGDVRGRVLEVAEDTYTKRFGGDRVTRSDVLHVTTGNRMATIVADLSDPGTLPPQGFDCVILTQTLQHIFDPRAAIRTIRRILAPGGVLLATAPGISQISRYDAERWGDYWRFTPQSMTRLWHEVFDPSEVAVEAYGNVFAASAFLHGLSVEDVEVAELEPRDADYPTLITVRAEVPGSAS